MIPLAPENLLTLPVVPSLPVAALPSSSNLIIDFKQLPSSLERAPASFLKLHMQTEDNGAFAIMDKLKTHALYDLTLMQSAHEARRTLDELTEGEFDLLLRVSYLFGRFIEQSEHIRRFRLAGSKPRIVFNHDPQTWDRPGLQAIERFHTHMYVLVSSTLEKIRLLRQPFSSLQSAYTRRRLVDPLAFLGPQILYDLLLHSQQTPPWAKIIIPDPTETVCSGLPLGLNIILEEGWNVLTRSWFGAYLLHMHQLMVGASNEIFQAFTGEDAIAAPGTRHTLLPMDRIHERIQRIPWLSTTSRLGLHQMAAQLRTASSQLLAQPERHPIWSVHHIILNGLAYTLSIMPSKPIVPGLTNNPLLMTVSVRLFSDIGGASLFGCEGVSALNIERGYGTFSSSDVEQRQAFQRSFLEMVRDEIPV
jgi:hypothetical protein